MTTGTYVAKDIKKSKFPATTSLQDTDTFDVVSNGQNLKITKANLVTELGSIGSLVSLGDVAATPVLSQTGSVNGIRAILGGSGITTGLSSQDAVEIEHNFDVDKTGVAVMANETAVSPLIRSIIAGSGISVAVSGDAIQISESAVPGSTKTVSVYEEADFPTAVGGVITLADDTQYLLLNDVSTSSRFVMGSNSVLSGTDNAIITLTYTGAGNMLTAVDVNFKLRNMKLFCTSGTLLDVSSTTGVHKMTMFFVNVSCDNIGDIDNYDRVTLDYVDILFVTQGLTLTNDFTVLRFGITYVSAVGGAGNAIDLGTATFDTITLENIVFDINSSGYCITGAASSANINTGGLGTITRASQTGSADLLDGISPYDNLWEMLECAGILNSTSLMLATHGGATIAIAAVDTPIIIDDTWTVQDNHRFTGIAGGRFTYTGKGAHVDVTASITGQSVTSTKTFRFFLYKNDVAIAASVVSRSFSTSDGNVSLIWNLELETDDYLELWVENTTDAVDFVVSALTMRIA